MKLYCTYCSAKKNTDSILLPAIERYQSKRIATTFDKAKTSGIQFVILSGKFGLLQPFDQIPYYDQLLATENTKEHAELVAHQLELLHVTELYYFTASEKSDPSCMPYLDCIRWASDMNGVELKIIEEVHDD